MVLFFVKMCKFKWNFFFALTIIYIKRKPNKLHCTPFGTVRSSPIFFIYLFEKDEQMHIHTQISAQRVASSIQPSLQLKRERNFGVCLSLASPTLMTTVMTLVMTSAPGYTCSACSSTSFRAITISMLIRRQALSSRRFVKYRHRMGYKLNAPVLSPLDANRYIEIIGRTLTWAPVSADSICSGMKA